ncbi:1-acyl-sn-glycerol-3-phosphate acyltransferase [Flavobacterium davisii]|uniref:Glycerol acyltransferase n=1 Tax=Flavobacterium davisii TaxID=2906077 RepID=A0A246GNL7_9FLAO|nr:glycerol acyltransferase [Flavobacterium davisii]
MYFFFIKIHEFVQRNRILAFLLPIVLLVILTFFACQIKFEEDITRVLPKNDKADVTSKIIKQLKFADKITVIIERTPKGTEDDLTETASVFMDSLQAVQPYVKGVQGAVAQENIKGIFDFVYQNLPLFLDEKDYQAIGQKIQTDSIKNRVEGNYKSLISPSGMITRDFIINDPLGISFIGLKKMQQLSIGDEFIMKDGYLLTSDRSKLLLFINPKYGGSETEKNTQFVAQLKAIQSAINTGFKNKTTLSYFGSPVIAVANANQIKSDIITTVLLSMGTLMFILIFFFRKVTIPIIIFIPTVFGVLFAVASLYFIRETISAISLSVGAVLLGVTIDYALHIMTHYRHNADVKQLYKDTAKPLIMSSSTTAVAFLCLLFVKSDALKDLGIFASISVMVSALFSLIIIPHLYKPKKDGLAHAGILDKLSKIPFERNKFLVIGTFVVLIISCFTFNKVTFNNNLGDLNFIPSDVKEAEAKLEASTSLTSKAIYVVAYGNSEKEAVEANAKLNAFLIQQKQAKKINNYSSLAGLLPSEAEQNQKIAQWKSFWTAGKCQNVQNQLVQQGKAFGFKPETHQAFYDLIRSDIQPLQLQNLKQAIPDLSDEYVSNTKNWYTIASIVKLDENRKVDFVKAIDSFANVVAIDRQQLNETFLGKLRDDFQNLVNYSFIAVILILFVFFKRIELVLASLLPITATGLVTAGLMALFGIQLNIFSTIVCTLIFGHGVDFTLFMTSALQKEYTTGKDEMPAYRISIILAALTTILAIGALIFAKHPALVSISSVSLLGVISALLITFVFYPIVFKWLFFKRQQKGNIPVRLFTVIISIIALTYYALGGIVFSMIGRFLIGITPGNKEAKTLLFRKGMAYFFRSVLKMNPIVKKKVINSHKIDFSKQAIVIANHVSVLDTLVFGMLTHKIVYLVNDWVYNSLIFGRAVRAMGYYPVSQGIEGGVDHLRKKMEEGYSLMIFPEGTRSDDNVVKRFHKGAFFLAEEFKLDILPVYIHGSAETSPKGDFMIHNESLTVVVGDYISYEDRSFGADYSARTKKINKFFRNEFFKVRQELEDANFFQRKVVDGYLYKEEEIYSAVKSDFEKYKNDYFEFFTLIKDDAKILHLADDYGQLNAVLTLQHPKRKVQALYSNEEKRAIASTHYLTAKRHIKCFVNEEEIKSCEVLLVATEIFENDKIVAFASQVNEVVLFQASKYISVLENQGFVRAYQKANLIVLKR